VSGAELHGPVPKELLPAIALGVLHFLLKTPVASTGPEKWFGHPYPFEAEGGSKM